MWVLSNRADAPSADLVFWALLVGMGIRGESVVQTVRHLGLSSVGWVPCSSPLFCAICGNVFPGFVMLCCKQNCSSSFPGKVLIGFECWCLLRSGSFCLNLLFPGRHHLIFTNSKRWFAICPSSVWPFRVLRKRLWTEVLRKPTTIWSCSSHCSWMC
jgi:hypothetical protein